MKLVEMADDTWPDGFVVLYREQWAPMVRLARLLTAPDAVAEELVQEAFLRVRGRWADVDNPVPYLRTAVVNACRNHHRRRVLERRRPVEVTPPTEEQNDLRGVIASLPDRQRAAVVLRYYEDLPETEIAIALGCSVGAVKSLLHRAMQDLRKVMER